MIFDVINKGIDVVFTEPVYMAIAVCTFIILTLYNFLTAELINKGEFKGFFFLEFVFAVLSLLWPLALVGASVFFINNCCSDIKCNIRRYNKMKEIKCN